jgi:hypothetical protein
MNGDTYSRRTKENDAQTVLYEIDLLRFARERLLAPQPWWTELDEWLYLEDFLLHYRNLIEFFGKQNPGSGDLSILYPERIWLANSPDKTILDSMTRPDLWEKYDTRDNDESISKCLHHRTSQRTVAKRWDVKIMYGELQPILERFESLLSEYKPSMTLTRTRGIGQSTLDGNSTTSTRTLDSGLNPER